MAKCVQCFKRANSRHHCAWCGAGPKCLNCKCPCRKWEDPETVVRKIGPVFDPPAPRQESR